MVDVDRLATLGEVALRFRAWRRDPWNPRYGRAGFQGVILSLLCDCGKGEYCPETGETYKMLRALMEQP